MKCLKRTPSTPHPDSWTRHSCQKKVVLDGLQHVHQELRVVYIYGGGVELRTLLRLSFKHFINLFLSCLDFSKQSMRVSKIVEETSKNSYKNRYCLERVTFTSSMRREFTFDSKYTGVLIACPKQAKLL